MEKAFSWLKVPTSASSVLNVKALEAGVGAFNPVKALVGAFSVIMNLRMDLIQALILIVSTNNIYWCVLEIPDGLLRPQ